MVLVTGPTGSGKSTTLAAIIDQANKTRKDHILTIEDPIEFVHKSNNCIVNHREVGLHTKSFASALRGALREDPDIILVGEMRDLETIALAMEAAMTGHLVFRHPAYPERQQDGGPDH
jgi:twitching motility protein PilT